MSSEARAGQSVSLFEARIFPPLQISLQSRGLSLLSKTTRPAVKSGALFLALVPRRGKKISLTSYALRKVEAVTLILNNLRVSFTKCVEPPAFCPKGGPAEGRFQDSLCGSPVAFFCLPAQVCYTGGEVVQL